eukprot:TRINITY_DN1667_c0_g2_i1.p1 TRINITY_DN1667_c0_g2~~TRINITY_DN1667_c0_g2_i1.p1  ORF type:complete len:745 (-),score=114.13 TRINITY_DN1667_c0_g2_i1:351-2585(-)
MTNKSGTSWQKYSSSHARWHWQGCGYADYWQPTTWRYQKSAKTKQAASIESREKAKTVEARRDMVAETQKEVAGTGSSSPSWTSAEKSDKASSKANRADGAACAQEDSLASASEHPAEEKADHQQDDPAGQNLLMQLSEEAWWWLPNIWWPWLDPFAQDVGKTLDGTPHDVCQPKGGADEKEEVSTACSESHTDLNDMAAEKDSRPYPVFTCRDTSALIGISDVVEFMRTAAVARYPARARFFELVQEAITDALGVHFQRLALVGSTALRIDTPESDLDVVAFTQGADVEDPGDEEKKKPIPAPCPVDALRWIAQALVARDATLRLQLVECSKVPVLTAVSWDGELSIDITVDQPLGETHVLWFQQVWHKESIAPPVHQTDSPLALPEPCADQDGEGWEQGLEALALRCVKLWLRRRRIPVSKEGGYPTVVWTLMVLHVLCNSQLGKDVSEEDSSRSRNLLRVLAEFFDRFCECRCSGQLLFSSGPEGMKSEFRPSAQSKDESRSEWQLPFGELSVLDPTASGHSKSCELATPLSSATRLLHAYELQRAQRLAAAAVSATSAGPLPCGEVVTPSAASGGHALKALFADAGDTINLMPSFLPAQVVAVIVLRDGVLHAGILREVEPKPGWCAPFLHRRDSHSTIALELCHVDLTSGAMTPRPGHEQWFYPSEFVCIAAVDFDEASKNRRGRRSYGCHWKLHADSLDRWRSMRELLWAGFKSCSKRDGNGGKHRQSSGRASWKHRA